ncbi:MAG: Na+/H+ antiporter NhaA [Myxococcota bacterium]|nr:Na+/H+ antiporter NhaA [Myxococcota bacterium]
MSTGMLPRPPRTIADRVARPFIRFLELETSAAILLLMMAVVALVWANSPWGETYAHFWHTPFALEIGPDEALLFEVELSLGHWVNDGLMVLFFFVVGMEIKRELVMGELSTRQRAMLPILGALGGMIVPAGIYAAFHWGEPTIRGWGIPMATDIAFAVAALSVLGSRVPPGLRVFLLALAIADDLGAVAVIAIFYTAEIHLASLGWAAGGLALCFAFNRAGVESLLVYVVIGLFVWYETHHSGVHATIAGVLLGFLTPTGRFRSEHETLVERGRSALEHIRELLLGEDDEDQIDYGGHQRHHAAQQLSWLGRRSLSPLDFLVNLLERPVAFVVMPLFALANAGVVLDAATFSDPEALQVAVAVALGLVVGKPLGITLFAWIAVRSGVATLPRGVNWTCVAATGVLAGIGFTVALFVTALAFTEAPVATAGSKVGILIGSLVATILGVAVLARSLPAASGAEASGH